ncbi:MAG: ABC transporter permease [Lachnospiraceae bacterium]|nr:ABC transporter permease [Lachnospiraceae bacterium]
MDLYRLEWMKVRPSVYRVGALGIFAGLLAMGITFLIIGKYEGGEEVLFCSWNGLISLIMALTVACFGVFCSVISAKVIVEEYCGKKAVTLFTYPVSRRKILKVKCRIILWFTVSSAFVSNISVIGLMYITARIFGLMPEGGSWYLIVTVVGASFIAGILSFEIGMAAAVIGWKKRSIMATVLSAVIIMCFVPNVIARFPDYIFATVLAAAVVFGLAAKAMYRILMDGIENMEV